MKRIFLPLIVTAVLFSMTSAKAFYDPSIGRWVNRDPLGEGRGSSAMMENVIGPFELFNGGNLYHFVYNDPVTQVDVWGLDVWVVQQNGGFGHQWAVGDNGNGTYWDSDKMPGKGPLAPLNCPPQISFHPDSGFDPKNLNPDFTIKRHVTTSSSVDKKVRDEAEKRARENKGRYDAACSNCRDHANGLADYAVGAKLVD